MKIMKEGNSAIFLFLFGPSNKDTWHLIFLTIFKSPLLRLSLKLLLF